MNFSQVIEIAKKDSERGFESFTGENAPEFSELYDSTSLFANKN